MAKSNRNRFLLDNLISKLSKSHPLDQASGLIYKETSSKFIEINQSKRFVSTL